MLFCLYDLFQSHMLARVNITPQISLLLFISLPCSPPFSPPPFLWFSFEVSSELIAAPDLFLAHALHAPLLPGQRYGNWHSRSGVNLNIRKEDLMVVTFPDAKSLSATTSTLSLTPSEGGREGSSPLYFRSTIITHNHSSKANASELKWSGLMFWLHLTIVIHSLCMDVEYESV